MQQIKIDLTKLNLIELKAIAFDAHQIILQQQESLNLIKAEIAKRSPGEHVLANRAIEETAATGADLKSEPPAAN